MRWCRFGDGRLGVVEGRVVRDVTPALDVLPPFHYPLPAHDVFIANLAAITARCRVLQPSAPSLPLEGVTFLSPIANPGKLIGAPVNYQRHLAEARDDRQIHANNPAHMLAIHEAGLFLKASVRLGQATRSSPRSSESARCASRYVQLTCRAQRCRG